MDHLVVLYSTANGLGSPSRVNGVSQGVDVADKHRDGNSFDVLNRNQRCGPLVADVEKGMVVGGPLLETVFFEVLCVVQNCFGGAAVRHMA